MIPFGYVGSVCKRIGSPGDPGEDTGYTDSLPAGRIANRYSVVDGQLVVRPTEDVEAEEQAAMESLAALAAKVAALEAEQQSAGIQNYTPQQVKDYIDAEYAAADTAAKVKQVTINLFKKVAVYLIKIQR